jgi:hypothetical protein
MAPAVPRSFSRHPPITGRDSCNNVASGNARLHLLSLSPAQPAVVCLHLLLHLRLHLHLPPPASCPYTYKAAPPPLAACSLGRLPPSLPVRARPRCKTMVSSTDELPAPLPLPLPVARYPRYPRCPPNETCRTRRAPTRLSWQRPLLHTHASATHSSLRDELCPPGPATTATPPLDPVVVTSSGTRAAPTCTMPANTTAQTASACPGASVVTTHAFISKCRVPPPTTHCHPATAAANGCPAQSAACTPLHFPSSIPNK